MTGAPLRLGLACTGWIADWAVHQPISRGSAAEVVAVASRDRGRAERYARRWQIRYAGSYAELLARPEVDAVYLATPNAQHEPMTRQALLAGKHVLCEKPFSWQPDSCRQLQELAARRGLLLWEAMHYRWHPAVRHLLAALDRLGDGTLRLVVEYGWPANRPADPRWQAAQAGGALLDVGCYGLDLIAALSPGPYTPKVSAIRIGGAGVDAEVALAVSGPQLSARLLASLVAPEFVCRVTAEQAGHRLSWQLPFLPVHPATGARTTAVLDGDPVPLPGTDRPSFDYQLAAFAAAVADLADRRDPTDPVDRRDPADSAAQAVAASGPALADRAALLGSAVRATQAAIRSANERRPVCPISAR